jgi:hypothetical protein
MKEGVKVPASLYNNKLSRSTNMQKVPNRPSEKSQLYEEIAAFTEIESKQRDGEAYIVN